MAKKKKTQQAMPAEERIPSSRATRPGGASRLANWQPLAENLYVPSGDSRSRWENPIWIVKKTASNVQVRIVWYGHIDNAFSTLLAKRMEMEHVNVIWSSSMDAVDPSTSDDAVILLLGQKCSVDQRVVEGLRQILANASGAKRRIILSVCTTAHDWQLDWPEFKFYKVGDFSDWKDCKKFDSAWSELLFSVKHKDATDLSESRAEE